MLRTRLAKRASVALFRPVLANVAGRAVRDGASSEQNAGKMKLRNELQGLRHEHEGPQRRRAFDGQKKGYEAHGERQVSPRVVIGTKGLRAGAAMGSD